MVKLRAYDSNVTGKTAEIRHFGSGPVLQSLHLILKVPRGQGCQLEHLHFSLGSPSPTIQPLSCLFLHVPSHSPPMPSWYPALAPTAHASLCPTVAGLCGERVCA